MPRRKHLFTLFLSFIFISLVLFMLAKANVFGFSGFVGLLFSPFEKVLLRSSQTSVYTNDTSAVITENNLLKRQLTEISKLQHENKDLRNQLAVKNPSPEKLLPAQVVGAPGFIPGSSDPDYLVIQAGQKQGIREGMPIVYENVLLGKIAKVTDYFSQVTLITDNTSSLAARDQTTESEVLGVVRGQDGGLLFDNVVLKEKITIGDIIVTNGDISLDGKGYPSGLMLGKISSVEKNQSALFQKASLSSLVDITHISTVFVLIK